MSHRRAFGQVFQLPSGRWRARYTTPTGERRSAPAPFTTRREAERFLTLTHAELLTGTGHTIAPTRLTLAEYVAEYLRAAGPSLRPSTLDQYRATADRWLLRPVGTGDGLRVDLAGLTLSALSVRLVRDWHAAVVSEARESATRRAARPPRTDAYAIRAWARAAGHPVAATGRLPHRIEWAWRAAGSPIPTAPEVPAEAGATAAAAAYRLLRTVLGQAVRDGLIPANPCQVKGAATAPHPERHPLTPAEVAALADAVADRYRAAVLVAAWSGLRPGELFALRRRDVDGRAVHVRRTLTNRRGHDHTFGPPKSTAGLRTVTLPRTVAEALAGHLATYTSPDPEALVFTTPTGMPLTARRRGVVMAAAREVIGRTDVTWHHLRHTGATLAAVAGATQAELQARIGHSTARAAAIYQHANTDRDRWLADRLDQLAAPAPAAVGATRSDANRSHLQLVRA